MDSSSLTADMKSREAYLAIPSTQPGASRLTLICDSEISSNCVVALRYRSSISSSWARSAIVSSAIVFSSCRTSAVSHTSSNTHSTRFPSALGSSTTVSCSSVNAVALAGPPDAVDASCVTNEPRSSRKSGVCSTDTQHSPPSKAACTSSLRSSAKASVDFPGPCDTNSGASIDAGDPGGLPGHADVISTPTDANPGASMNAGDPGGRPGHADVISTPTDANPGAIASTNASTRK